VTAGVLVCCKGRPPAVVTVAAGTENTESFLQAVFVALKDRIA